VILKDEMVGGRERVTTDEERVYTARRLKTDQVVKIVDRLTGCKNFVGKREKFIFNACVDLKPTERFENGSDMYGFRSPDNSARKRVLDLLEPVKLTVWKAAFLYQVHIKEKP